jgi:hypothetical protein
MSLPQCGIDGHEMTLWVDVVEKVARSVGIVLLGRFDPAELSRQLGFVAAGLAATLTRTRLA